VSSPDVLSASALRTGGPSLAESPIPEWVSGRRDGFTPRVSAVAPTSLDRGGNKSRRCEGIVLRNRETRRFLAVRCGRWSCEVCGDGNRRAFIKRVRLGLGETDAPAAGVGRARPPRLLTLTSPPREDPRRSQDLMKGRFQRLRQRVAERYGRGFEYAGVVELTKAGSPHLHVVFRGPWVAQAEWSRLAEAVGFGRVVDVRRVRSGDVARYAAKGLSGYLAKSFGVVWPRHFRRVRFSRSWAPSWVVRRRVSDGLWRRVVPGEPEFEVYLALRYLDGLRGGQGPPRAAVGGFSPSGGRPVGELAP
jgi:hypothetical protein